MPEVAEVCRTGMSGRDALASQLVFRGGVPPHRGGAQGRESFQCNLTVNLTLVAFLEFDSTISVNKQSQISKSYTTG